MHKIVLSKASWIVLIFLSSVQCLWRFPCSAVSNSRRLWKCFYGICYNFWRYFKKQIMQKYMNIIMSAIYLAIAPKTGCGKDWDSNIQSFTGWFWASQYLLISSEQRLLWLLLFFQWRYKGLSQHPGKTYSMFWDINNLSAYDKIDKTKN